MYVQINVHTRESSIFFDVQRGIGESRARDFACPSRRVRFDDLYVRRNRIGLAVKVRKLTERRIDSEFPLDGRGVGRGKGGGGGGGNRSSPSAMKSLVDARGSQR